MIRYLNEFIHLAQTCSFQETAEALFISQSSLSKHIRSLEEELGYSLFDRTTRKVTLSRLGGIFYTYAVKFQALEENLASDIAIAQQETQTRIYIGSIGDIASYGLYETINQFRSLYPQIKVTVMEEKNPILYDLLQSEKCDFCITDALPMYRTHEFEHSIFHVDHLIAMFPENHPLSKQESINVTDLKNDGFVIHYPPIEYDSLWRFKSYANYQPEINAQVSFNSTIPKLVAMNIGIAVMSGVPASKVTQDGVVIREFDPVIPSNVYIIRKLSRAMTSAGKLFLNFIRDHLPPT